MGSSVFLIIFFVVAYIGIKYYERAKEDKRVEEGVAIKREKDFFKQTHTFITKAQSLDEVLNAMDIATIEANKIKYKVADNRNRVEFRLSNKLDVVAFWRAVLSDLGYADDSREKKKYQFNITEFMTSRGKVDEEYILIANILLTAIEKAFFKLDSETVVQRIHGKYK